MIRSCFGLALEDYLFLYADLWELKYASSDCQLNSYQGGDLHKRERGRGGWRERGERQREVETCVLSCWHSRNHSGCWRDEQGLCHSVLFD